MQNDLFIEAFSDLEDPRVERTKKHLLLDIVGLSLFSVLAGATSWTEMEDFCRLHEEWLKQYFVLPNGIPSHDTFSRLFSALAPDAFQECFLSWMRAVVNLLPEDVVAIDGKTLRGSKQPSKGLKALHVVSAWSCKNGVSLGQIKVDKKTNEIKVIPELLEKICLEGAIVTLDAMGCQKNIADCIVKAKCDYILRVKANQSGLLGAMQNTFDQAQKSNYNNILHYAAKDETNNDHGRIETRECVVLPQMYLMQMRLSWRGLKSLVLVTSQRETNEGLSIEHRYYVSSLDPKEPEKILRSIRSHWQIENNCHWVLDMAFKEDNSRIREENAALNMAWLRKTALGLLKRATHIKASIRRKQLMLWARPEGILKTVQI